MLGDPLTPEDPVALGPLRGFAKAQAPLAPRTGVAQTFLVFILLLAWAQAGADRDFLVVLAGHQEGSGGHVGKSSRFSPAVPKTGPGWLQGQEALPTAACSFTMDVMRCTSPCVGHGQGQQLPWERQPSQQAQGSGQVHGDEAGPRSSWRASRVHGCGGAETATTAQRRAGGPRLSLNGLLGT